MLSSGLDVVIPYWCNPPVLEFVVRSCVVLVHIHFEGEVRRSLCATAMIRRRVEILHPFSVLK